MHNFAKKGKSKGGKSKGKMTYRKAFARLKTWQKVLVSAGVFIVVFSLASVAWAGVNINALKTVYAESIAAKQSFEYAQAELGQQDLEQAKLNLEEAEEHFATANKKFRRFKVFKVFPGVRAQMIAVENVLEAGLNLSGGMVTLLDVANDVMSVADSDQETFQDITVEEKREVLEKLYNSQEDLAKVKEDIEVAAVLIEEIPEKGLLKPIRTAVEPVQEQLPLLETVIHQAIPLAQSIPTIMGYPDGQQCLFFLQNNNELRPTGGFWGTYGEVFVQNGEVGNLYTENIYSIDEPSKNTITEPAPGPISQHTGTTNALLRNENWWPHFPYSAQKGDSKFEEEGGNANIDCVFVVNIPFIVDLMAFTGPITVNDIEFNQDNLFYELQHQVEFAYNSQGIDDLDRKDIIGDMGDIMMDRLFSLPQSEFPALWETFKKNADEKHIQVFFYDDTVQNLMVELDWAGEMTNYGEGDFLMFVDANLAALKTDEVMERSLTYNVSEQDGDIVGEAAMRYFNDGQFDGTHTRYRTYTRVYVPQGAELLEHSGFLTGDKTQGGVPTEPEVYDETFTMSDGTDVTYTVIAGFFAVEPKAEGTIRVKYRLPDSVKDQIRGDQYTLTVQKQAGTHNPELDFSFDVGKGIESAHLLDIEGEIRDNNVSYGTDLRVDRDFVIDLK